MSTGLKVLLALIVAGGISLLSLVFLSIGFQNDCVRSEKGLNAQYSQNQNNYANYFNKIKEMAQVPGMYAGKLEELYKATMEGRYGKDGSKALVQFITEQNPTLDPKMYVTLQQEIAAGRDNFAADQKTLLDKKQNYEYKLEAWPGSFLAGFLGFPKIDLSKIDIVINDATQKAFDSKRAGPISLTD
jgi:hypothetical protein